MKVYLNRHSWILFFATAGYFLLFCLCYILGNFIFDGKGFSVLSKESAYTILPLVSVFYCLIFLPTIYIFNSTLAKQALTCDASLLIMYMGVCGFLGPLFEIAINSVSRFLFGGPIWIYHFLPLHNGDTSAIMSLFWPLYGVHAYFLHKALGCRFGIKSNTLLAIFVGVDAIVIEVLVNIVALTFFSTFIFYYLPGDLQHLSTGLIFIPYIVVGFMVANIILFLEQNTTKLDKMFLGLSFLVFTVITTFSALFS